MSLKFAQLLHVAACAGILLAAVTLMPDVPAQSPTVITACVAKSNGTTRIVASPSACIPGLETPVQFNQSGPPGSTGAKGSTGATGAQGIAGPAGGAGPKGSTGATGSNGLAGTDGATGATGATGPAGSGTATTTYTSTLNIPGNFTGSQSFLVPILGANNPPGVFPGIFLASPTSCTVTNFTASIYNLNVSPSQAAKFFLYNVNPISISPSEVGLCNLASVQGCTANPNFAIPKGYLLGYELFLPNAQDFANTTMFLTLTCQ